MNEQVYVSLMDEGVRVWRPVPARKIAPGVYVLGSPPDYDRELESWEFPPGSTVIAENRKTANGNILAAVRLAQKGKKSA
jgi:hypothetical protein